MSTSQFAMRIKQVSLGGLILLFSSIPVHAAVSPQLTPEPVHSQVIRDIASSLVDDHYSDITVDDSLSSKVLDSFVDNLDPSKAYFFADDIKSFESYRTLLDDQIKAGNLDAGFEIFNRYQQRITERLTFLITRLENAEMEIDFTVDESLMTDRTNSDWTTNQTDMDEFWRKRLKSTLLNLKLAGKDISEAKQTLLKRYKNQLTRVEQTNPEDVFQSYANAFAQQFDPHTQYFSPRRSENFNINMSLSLEGIGAVLQTENENTKIVRLVPAGPAEKTGQIKPSDVIVGVGQGITGEVQDIIGWRLDEVVALIRGPKGTTVRLEFIPADAEDGTRRIVSIIRNKVKLEEQSAQKRVIELDRDGSTYRLGVISIPTFYIDFNALKSGDANYKSTTRDVEKLIKELQREDKIDGLIVDLRDNGGGSLREANELVGLFINRGPTVQIRDQQGRVNILQDSNPKVVYHGPMAVLVNRLSASASEIFAGAIQDYQRGIIVGNQTFGKGTVQTLSPLRQGQLKLTHAKFYRISGDSTQHKGVVPDIRFPSLYDIEKIGESALDGALPWDQVHPVPHRQFISLTGTLPELTARHKARIETDPDFRYMQAQIDRITEIKNDNLITLNETMLQAERDASEAWQLNVENQRRSAKQLPALDKLSDLEATLEKDSQGRIINPEAEAILAETGRILLDVISVTYKKFLAKQ